MITIPTQGIRPPTIRRGGVGLLETASLAWSSLLANKLRSVLTVLGIVIGIAAVLATTAVGRGAQEATNKQLQSLGSNLLYVTSGSTSTAGGIVSQGAGTATTLTLEDARAIARTCPAVWAVTPTLNSSAQVVWGGSNTRSSIVGTTPEYMDVQDFLPLTGRFFTGVEVDRAARAAVLGQTVVKNLGLTAQRALGKRVRIRGEDFLVVGTLEYKGSTGFRDQDDQVLLPVTTMASRIVGVNSVGGISVGSISVSARGAEQMEAAQFQMTNLLRQRHKIVPPEEDDFSIRNQADLLNSVNQIGSIFTLLLGTAAAISLVVGGIGIMNIMLVSVIERTREIGIRKAVGARPNDILQQFLIESVVLSVSGGLVGVALGLASAQLIRLVLGWQTSVTVESAALALGVSCAIGILFGVWPARQAARLDPIAALRSD